MNPAAPPTKTLLEQLEAQRNDARLYTQAAEAAREYVASVRQQRVFPAESALKGLQHFQEPLPQTMTDALDVLQMLHRHGSPATVAQTGGRYFGFVCGGTTPAAMAASWLASVWDQNPALYVLSPVVSTLETVCEGWLKALLGLPDDTVAGYVGGTSMATFCGLAAARHRLLERSGWDVNRQGLIGAPRLRVVLGGDAHGTVYKALALLGFGTDAVERVPADAQGRLDPAQLPPLDERTVLILQAGNVNSGAFDPMIPTCQVAREAGAWVHVDGAFGLWAAASQKTAHLTLGIDMADSWSVDAHKTLNAPYDCGIVLCRHPEALAAALHLEGAYIQRSQHRDGMIFTPDMSRRARAVELWATLKALGSPGVEALVDSLCERARQFAQELGQAGFRVLNEVVFNQVLVACDTPQMTRRTLEGIQGSGQCWCGGSVWDGEPVIRVSVCNWATGPEDVSRAVRAFVDASQAARASL